MFGSLSAANPITSRCPFLSKASPMFMKRAGNSLVLYAERCPVMGGLLQSASSATSEDPHRVLRPEMKLSGNMGSVQRVPDALRASIGACPLLKEVHGRAIHTDSSKPSTATADNTRSTNQSTSGSTSGKCPFSWKDLFLNTVKGGIGQMVNLVPAQMQSGAKVFDYQNFFQDKIQAKKKTESYRQFRVVQRNTSSFPIANVIDNSNHKPL